MMKMAMAATTTTIKFLNSSPPPRVFVRLHHNCKGSQDDGKKKEVGREEIIIF